MKVNVIRGKNQIGGNIIEISTDRTKILLDVGLELDDENTQLPDVEGLFSDAAFNAVFVSHYHGDHLGLAYYIDKKIPLYVGEASYRIVKAADDYKGVDTIQASGYLRNNTPIVIGDITVTPFLCDHSAFDSYMLLCEANGERILYTGDFRDNGRKSFNKLLRSLPDNVDKLICEGTTLSRYHNLALTEAQLEEQAVKEFRSTKGPIFVLQSSTNIDRIVTMYRSALRSGRIFLQELYMAEIASAAGNSIPNPAFDNVYTYITNPSKHEGLRKYRRMRKDQIAKSQFVMCIRNSMLHYLRSLNELMSFKDGLLVYSMWNGYKNKPEMAEFIADCEKMGLLTVNIHTSGHADENAIGDLINTVHPNVLIPIHTENAKRFREIAPDLIIEK